MNIYPEFSNLFEQINSFMQICSLVPTKLSDFGQSHFVSDIDKEYWRKHLPNEVKQFYIRLQHELDAGFEEHKMEIDSDLEFFRTLSRYISEAGPGPCIWSDYYDDIDNIMDRIHVLLLYIDRKYKLGQHKNDP